MLQKIKNFYHFLQAFAAVAIAGFPSRKLTVIGVTGTDGKSTTSAMIYQILNDSGKKTAVANSVFVRIDKNSYGIGDHVTTPSSFAMQKFLKIAKDKKIDYFVIEATSQGLDQNRLAFIPFKVVAITNVTNDHLDYHVTWQHYLVSKAKLFKNVEFSILNSGDKSYKFLKNRAKGKILTYGSSKKADFNLQNFPIKLKIFGNYNLTNALCAAAVCTALGIEKKTILKSLAKYQSLPGRMQKVDLGQKFDLYIDFAHTPNALEQALKTLSSLKTQNSKLICVFGAAGERDSLKRPQMGKAAAKFADTTILTAEDPRSEKVDDIARQIASGLISGGKRLNKDFFIIANRRNAITRAANMARDHDIVALFGKGHEKSMSFKDREIPWDEKAEAIKAIRGLKA